MASSAACVIPFTPMRYRIRSTDGHRVVLGFSMPERPVIILFLSLAALVCLVIGLAYALAPENTGDSLRALSFTGFGLFCLSAIFLVSGAYSRAFPSRLVFDNERGILELFGREEKSIGTVPYDGIGGFSVCRTVEDRVARHSLGIDLVRGGRWELYASQRRVGVEAFREALAAAVKLTVQPSAPVQVASAEERLPLEREGPDVLRVTWKRTSHPLSLIVSLVVLLSFVAALVGTKPFATGPGAYAAAVAFGGFFLLAALASLARTIGERMQVRIGRGSLEYERRAALSRRKCFKLALSQVAAVDFSMSFSRIGTRIVMLQPQEVEPFGRYRQGTFSPGEIPGLVTFLRGLARIDVSALELEQRLALAELIREKVLGDRSR